MRRRVSGKRHQQKNVKITRVAGFFLLKSQKICYFILFFLQTRHSYIIQINLVSRAEFNRKVIRRKKVFYYIFNRFSLYIIYNNLFYTFVLIIRRINESPQCGFSKKKIKMLKK